MESNIIAQRINEAMKKKNIKQSEIVAKANIPKSSISSYLSGKYIPKQTNIYKIANVLNVNPAWLMGYDVPEFEETDNINNAKKTDIEDVKNKINSLPETEMSKENKKTLIDMVNYFHNLAINEKEEER